MRRFLLLFVVFALAAMAADVSGTWKGTAESPNGTIERTFVFKVDGAKLTGETTSQMTGKSTIENGKVEGDSISFTITANFQGNEMKLNYTGKLSGDQLKLHVEAVGADFSIDYIAKRVS